MQWFEQMADPLLVKARHREPYNLCVIEFDLPAFKESSWQPPFE